MELSGKNVVYIGGFGGIGQKCVDAFLRRGIHQLVICDLQEDSQFLNHLIQTYSRSVISYLPIDVTQRESIAMALKSAAEAMSGRIDILVNGCGLMNDRLIERTIDINLTGVIHSSLIALEYMDKSKGGQGGMIVNISSVAGLEPSGMFAIYSAAKAGLAAFTRAIANPLYYSHTGVSFVTICPGFTDTALLDSIRGKETLTEYAAPMAQRFLLVKRQNAEMCAKNIVHVVEKATNGSVWMLDIGEVKEMKLEVLWRPAMNE